MSSGSLPPVPDLIPIAALLRNGKSVCPVDAGGGRQIAAAGDGGVMGEQRSRRPAGQPAAVESIDTGASRGPASAALRPPPQSRKATRSDHRQRRRREHRRPAATRRTRTLTEDSVGERVPPNPRVNPIFVWIRQEDTRIVDVKCEDYDKRNRILLTKTAQGWRAIPRTETLVPSLKDAAEDKPHHHHHHHHRRKSRKGGKVRRRSAAVQVDAPDDDDRLSPTWTSPVNVESHLPSHKIHVSGRCPSPETERAPAPNDEERCGAGTCDVASPLDNLLAVAEFEFNQHMQSGEWSTTKEKTDDESKEFIDNIEQLDDLLASCSKETDDGKTEETESKNDDCDYTEDDDNNIGMDDILSRLEQSLRSPEEADEEMLDETTETRVDAPSEQPEEEEEEEEAVKPDDTYTEETNEIVPEPAYEPSPENTEETKTSEITPPQEEVTKEPEEEEEEDNIVESSTTIEDEPTDLSLKSKYNDSREETTEVEEELPTDLSVPKNQRPSPQRPLTPIRPPSQNSEAIQSPQPSGIPAVPPSPDIVTSNTTCAKSKSMFLESLLSTNQKVALNSEVTIVRQKEPLDLGTCRKSASPTITCSEEVKKRASDNEPPTKKFKSDGLTLKNLLDVETARNENKQNEKTNVPETPKLLELLKNDTDPDPLTQLRQVLCDTSVNVPDPMLVPKERLSQIISHPAREIPKLLKQRPELRLPEALAFPHLLQDPDILVITLQQLETIIIKQNQSMVLKDSTSIEKTMEKSNTRNNHDTTKNTVHNKKKNAEEVNKKTTTSRENQMKNMCFNDAGGDIDAATTAAFNQALWLPYLNQMEAMSFANPDILKLLSVPIYPGQNAELNHLINSGRFPSPLAFPLQQPPLNYNPSLELSMWQEAMLQANMLRPKPPFDNLTAKNYFDKMNFVQNSKKSTSQSNKPPTHSGNKSTSLPNNYYPLGSNHPSMTPYQNTFLNLPGYQTNTPKTGLQIPHYNPSLLLQKSPINHHQSGPTAHPYLSKPSQHKADTKSNYPTNFYHDKIQQQQVRPKLACKPFANVSYQKDTKEKTVEGTKPIDLSGAPAAKLKVKQHLVDPAGTTKLLKHEDVPEVGSTTASIEDMQDAHKHLWHPLFGNQKGYNSPWNWTTVTATAE